MNIKPSLHQRKAQPYMAITAKLPMEEIPALLPPLIPEIAEWLKQNGIAATGPPFFNYVSITGGILEAEVGYPVNVAIPGNERVKAGIFPAGQYLVATHWGHYQELRQVHPDIEAWRKARGIEIKGPRTEFYPVDPALEPDPKKWQTNIVIQLAEPPSNP